MADRPDQAALTAALQAAGAAHHEYEVTALGGQRDEQWAAFYAAYALGRLGDFMPPSTLSRVLAAVEADDDWASAAARDVLGRT